MQKIFETEDRVDFLFDSSMDLASNLKRNDFFINSVKLLRLYLKCGLSYEQFDEIKSLLPINSKIHLKLPVGSRLYESNFNISKSLEINCNGSARNQRFARQSFDTYQLIPAVDYETKEKIKVMRDQFESLVKPESTFLVVEKATQKLLGGIIFIEAEKQSGTELYIGWIWIERSVQGPIRAMVRAAFEKLIFQRNTVDLHASVYSFNFRSLHFFKSSGFQPVCILC